MLYTQLKVLEFNTHQSFFSNSQNGGVGLKIHFFRIFYRFKTFHAYVFSITKTQSNQVKHFPFSSL